MCLKERDNIGSTLLSIHTGFDQTRFCAQHGLPKPFVAGSACLTPSLMNGFVRSDRDSAKFAKFAIKFAGLILNNQHNNKHRIKTSWGNEKTCAMTDYCFKQRIKDWRDTKDGIENRLNKLPAETKHNFNWTTPIGHIPTSSGSTSYKLWLLRTYTTLHQPWL